MRLRRCAAAARRRLAAEHGYSLSEMLVVLVIITIVVSSLVALFVSSSNAQVDMTRRFEAQQEMRLALDKLRREIHCAKEVSWTGGLPTSEIRITLGDYCPTNNAGTSAIEDTFTWCTVGSGQRHALWRYNNSACSGIGRKEADYLIMPKVFTAYPTPSPGPFPAGQLPTLSVDLPVDINPADGKQSYKLTDDIVIRNATR
jgi:prepilin-type N-terminal cleavage/methylation domain-containing protein